MAAQAQRIIEDAVIRKDAGLGDKLLDKAMNRGHLHAVLYFEEFWYQERNGTSDNAELNAKALMASWER